MRSLAPERLSTTTAYEPYFGLRDRPFRTVPDGRSVFWSDTHQRALAALRYGLMRRAPLIMLTGDAGSGKTTLLRHLLIRKIRDARIALVNHIPPPGTPLLPWVLSALDGSSGEARPEDALARLRELLVSVYAGGQRTVLMIDEAQNLQPAMLDELSMMLNINADRDELLQVALVGHTRLRARLNQPEPVQLAQRIAVDCDISPLGPVETGYYIRHRLAVAGTTRKIFEDDAVDVLHAASGGMPRRINVLCDLLMSAASAAGMRLISRRYVAELIAGTCREGLYRQIAAPVPALVAAERHA
ncbi:MAG: AAA family ATPase [Pseudomonadota bacterium]